ncbi:hypothetical protein [Qipengyuania sp. ASV99]|uniref:hypothetical protein n=1 Tax=Qipengyuania sp. ASV99 TaxID=3399681 RepID=UPI003A4C6476
MRGLLKSVAALLGLVAAPLAATTPEAKPSREQAEVMLAADAFFAALRSEDRTALAAVMLSEGVIFIHSRMNPDLPRVDAVPVADHLARWGTRSGDFDELMSYDHVLVDGDMAQVWGPYRFLANGATSHCGVNSLSLVRTESGWKVANTSFTMEPPTRCAALGAPEAPEFAL